MTKAINLRNNMSLKKIGAAIAVSASVLGSAFSLGELTVAEEPERLSVT